MKRSVKFWSGKFWSWIVRASESRLLSSLPLFIYLFLSSVYFLSVLRLADGPGSHTLYWLSTDIESDETKYAAELLKQKFQLVGYGLSVAIVLFRLGDFFRFCRREGSLLCLFSVLLLTTLVSDNPQRVVTNLMHLVFGVVAIWIYFQNTYRRRNAVRSAALIMFYSLVFVQLMSVVWFFAHPDGSIYKVLSGQRQGGLAGNPNTFGGVCVASTWAILTLIFLQEKHKITSVCWLIPIAIVGFNAWTTGSATTLVDIVVVILLFILVGTYGKLSRKTQSILIVVIVMVVFGVLFWFVVQQNLLKLAESATGSMGKDLTFTGRLDLWMLALEAIAERPILGWSYDNHATVLDNPAYAQQYNHFHNGFLDTLIVGGGLFGIAVLVNFYAFASRIRRISAKGVYVFPLVIGVAAACMHNLTEYSMFRNNTVVWMMYLVCFVSLAMQFTGGVKSRNRVHASSQRANKHDSSRRSRSKRYRW